MSNTVTSTETEWDHLLLQLGLNPDLNSDVTSAIDELGARQQNIIRDELNRLNNHNLNAHGYIKYLRFGIQQGLEEIA